MTGRTDAVPIAAAEVELTLSVTGDADEAEFGMAVETTDDGGLADDVAPEG